MKDRSINIQGELGLRVWFGQTRGMDKAHIHHDLEFNYVLQGSMTYLIGGRVFTIPQGRLAAIWGAMPHQSVLREEGTQLMWGTLPLGGMLLGRLPGAFVGQLLGVGVVVEGEHDPADLPTFQRWDRDLAQGDQLRQELVMREMELRLHRMAILFEAEPTGRRKRIAAGGIETGGAGLGPVQRMAAYISEHFRQPMSAGDVADAVDLHPNYAMTLFRQHTQMTINTYLTRQRVAHAQRLLATSDEPILAIGLHSGFGSASRFFEAFKTHAGCSPRAYRQRMAKR